MGLVQAFSLDRESGIPVKLQLKAQVKYQVATGLLLPGDQLPPLRDLAAGLGVNLNTVIRVVDELVAEGLLISHQGKGVFVTESAAAQIPGAALRSLLAGALGPMRDWGMTPEDAALALMAHGSLARAPQTGTWRLWLTGTSRADLHLLQRELQAALPGVTVVAALPEDLVRPGASKLVATTLFHSLPALTTAGLQRIALAGAPEKESLARLLALPPGAAVAVVAGEWIQAARIRQSLESARTEPLEYRLATRTEELRSAAAGAAWVVAAQSGRKMAQEVLAERPDLPLLIEPLQVTPEALSAIRQALGTPAPTPGVQVRSSWV